MQPPVEDKVLKVCYYLYFWFSVPVKTNGKWLPVENVFSSLQDIWHLAERWGKHLCEHVTKDCSPGCCKFEPELELSHNRIGPVRDDNRVSYLTGTTRFIKFYINGRIINHFEYIDHCHQCNGSSNHLTKILRTKWAQAWHHLRNPCISSKQVVVLLVPSTSATIVMLILERW